ncbi:MAG: aspartate aminotransferase family protein, partial [Mesorhizobium sp.]
MKINIRDIREKDRNSVLHPFTQLKDFATGKLGEPTIVETGKGIRIQDAHGNQLI